MINTNFNKWLSHLAISKINLMLVHYRELKISDQEAMVILQIQNMINANLIINPNKIADFVELDAAGVDHVVAKLVDQKLLTIKAYNNKIIFNLSNLYIKIFKLINQQEGTFSKMYYYIVIDELETLLKRSLNEKEKKELQTNFKTNNSFKEIYYKILTLKDKKTLPLPFNMTWIYNLKNIEPQRVNINKNLDYNWLEE